MPSNELLDDDFDKNSDKKRLLPIPSRSIWYVKHGTMIIAFHAILYILIFKIAPLLPTVIEDAVNGLLLGVLIFGIYGITLYTYIKEFEWNLFGALVGGTIIFFVCFVYIMNNLSAFKDSYGDRIAAWFRLPAESASDILDIMLVGVGYSILIVPFTEIMVLIAVVFKWIVDR